MKTASERFLEYVTFDTMSDEFSESCPSTDKQKVFGAYLVQEMKDIGIQDAFMDEHGYIYGTVPGDPGCPPSVSSPIWTPLPTPPVRMSRHRPCSMRAEIFASTRKRKFFFGSRTIPA